MMRLAQNFETVGGGGGGGGGGGVGGGGGGGGGGGRGSSPLFHYYVDCLDETLQKRSKQQTLSNCYKENFVPGGGGFVFPCCEYIMITTEPSFQISVILQINLQLEDTTRDKVELQWLEH